MMISAHRSIDRSDRESRNDGWSKVIMSCMSLYHRWHLISKWSCVHYSNSVLIVSSNSSLLHYHVIRVLIAINIHTLTNSGATLTLRLILIEEHSSFSLSLVDSVFFWTRSCAWDEIETQSILIILIIKPFPIDLNDIRLFLLLLLFAVLFSKTQKKGKINA